MTEVQLRNYDPASDFEGLQSLLQEAGLYDEDYETPEKLERWVDIQPDAIVLATSENRIIGSVYFQDGIILYAFRLAVREAFQRQGIGSALLSEAERRAKAVGHPSIELNVTEGHPELVEFYRRRGYQPRITYMDMVKEF